jgi:hypothetical protein
LRGRSYTWSAEQVSLAGGLYKAALESFDLLVMNFPLLALAVAVALPITTQPPSGTWAIATPVVHRWDARYREAGRTQAARDRIGGFCSSSAIGVGEGLGIAGGAFAMARRIIGALS